MIKVENLSYSFPQKDLFNKVSFEIEDGQHCAFIGQSGIGKSTLIDIIMDPERYMFDGKLEIEQNCRIGYVNQFSQVEKAKETTVFEYIGQEFIKLQNEINIILGKMETAYTDSLLEEYQEAIDAFDAIGGDNFESLINKKLNLANLSKHKDKMLSELSGGEFKLIQVIKEMLNSPDLLIMDEPNVFLDFENLNALKNLINSHKGTILVITHNRYLLNNCFNKVLHLENMEIQEFNGSYIDYNFELLQSKIELQELATIDDEEIKRNEALIDRLRFNANQNAEAAIGKKVNARAKIIERLEARRIKAPFLAIKEPNIHFTSEDEIQEEKILLKVDNYSLTFDDLLLENVSFEINSTDKVALIGPNGTGKTTLLKEIFEDNNDSIEINADVQVAYLSQIQGETLNESNTIADEFFDAGFKTYDEIESCILDYGFDKEMINQKIGFLSGGEKNMLQLAKISAKKSDLLLLDEPTSHLDTYSQIALEKALQSYKGAILMISHDYYTIVNSMDYVLILEDKTLRKMSMRKFRKMVYNNYFDRNYLEIEEKKTLVENKIELALKNNDFEQAKILSEELEKLIKLLK